MLSALRAPASCGVDVEAHAVGIACTRESLVERLYVSMARRVSPLSIIWRGTGAQVVVYGVEG